MYTQDYLLLQIEAFAQALGKIIQLKKDGDPNLLSEFIKKTYSEMKIDRNFIINSSSKDLTEMIKDKDEKFLSHLVSFVVEDAELENDLGQRKLLLQKAFIVTEWIDQNSSTFSFDRINQKNMIEKLISQS